MIIHQNGFIHHVFFYPKNEGNKRDREQLIEGLKILSHASPIKDFHIGIPAQTPRDVVDNLYAVSWLLLLDSKEDHDIYQTDPIHLKFIADCAHLWTRVANYDTLNAG